MKTIEPTDTKIHHYMVTGQYKLTGDRAKHSIDPYFFKGGHAEALAAAKKYMEEFYYNGTLWAVLGGPKGKRVAISRAVDQAKQQQRIDKNLVAATKRLTKLGILGELSFSNADNSIQLSRDNY